MCNGAKPVSPGARSDPPGRDAVVVSLSSCWCCRFCSFSENEVADFRCVMCNMGRDANIGIKCPKCLSNACQENEASSLFQCAVCDHQFVKAEAYVIGDLEGRAPGGAFTLKKVNAPRNSFLYDCPACLAVLQVPRAEKIKFRCSVCGHASAVTGLAPKRAPIPQSSSAITSIYDVVKLRQEQDEMLFYSPFSREISLLRNVPKECDCSDHDKYHNRGPGISVYDNLGRDRLEVVKAAKVIQRAYRRRLAALREARAKRDSKLKHRKSRLSSILPSFKKTAAKDENEGGVDLYAVCLTCQRRLCETCDNVVHSHPERKSHLRVSYGIFQRSKFMFLRFEELGELIVDPADNLRYSIGCGHIASVAPSFFPKKEANIIALLMRNNEKNFGSHYQMVVYERVEL